MPSSTTPRVYLEICIGDKDKDANEQADWSLTANYMQSKAQQVSISHVEQGVSHRLLHLSSLCVIVRSHTSPAPLNCRLLCAAGPSRACAGLQRRAA